MKNRVFFITIAPRQLIFLAINYNYYLYLLYYLFFLHVFSNQFEVTQGIMYQSLYNEIKNNHTIILGGKKLVVVLDKEFI